MPGLKKYHPDVRFNSNKVTPDEMDVYEQYVILHPSVSQSYVGALSGGGTLATGTIALTQPRLDYPRNLLMAYDAGTTGGTLTVNGKDQFGGTISETLGLATAAGSANVNGTKVFAEVTSTSWSPAGADDADYAGTVNLGVSIATSATGPLFGLPQKLGGTSDIKAITWVDNDVAKTHDAAAAANTAFHAFKGTVAVAAADSYVVLMKSTYNAENESDVANL